MLPRLTRAFAHLPIKSQAHWRNGALLPIINHLGA
jgi:hypothetical protein